MLFLVFQIYSKIEAGQIEIFKSEFDLIRVLDMLFIAFRQKINGSKIEFIKNYKENRVYIKTDENKLKQILTNLLNNAFKFTHKGSIQVGFKLKKKFIEIYVKDTGIGISKEEQKIIFDRFRQVEITTARKYGGTGLGLSISKAFLNKMGGKIWLESEKEKGSKFYFTIPIEKTKISNKKDEDSNLETQKTFHFENKTILIAEDEESNFVLLETIFEKSNANLIHAKNGKIAVEKVKTEKIDLILMDIKMPILDGLEATRQIKQINKAIPIIAQTAYAMTDDKAKALKAGCDDYITKPIDEEKLNDILNKYI